MKKTNKLLILLLVIILLTGCSNTEATSNTKLDSTTDELNLKDDEINALNSTIAECNSKISDLESELTKAKEENKRIKDENDNLLNETRTKEEANRQESNRLFEQYKAKIDDIILHIPDEIKLINLDGKGIKDRFNLPEGFERVIPEEGSFGEYIQNLPLKEHGVQPKLFNGDEFFYEEPQYVTVIDMPLGNKDLEQSSDSAIRLNAEYLFKVERYEDISYPFASGFNAEYSKWMEGYRLVTKDNQLEWVKKSSPSNTYEDLKKYLDIVYSYSNTEALNHYLKPVELKDIQIGDMFVKKDCIGRCVMVVDMAINKSTNEKIVLLAMSNNFIASEIGIIKNIFNRELVCWFQIPSENVDTNLKENVPFIHIPGDGLLFNWIRRF